MKTILSLCDLSGIWSQHYKDNGYNVIQLDLATGTDIRLLQYPGQVHGILAAPPCTKFCRPSARLWKQWGEEGVLDALSIVDACLRFVAICKPTWWCLENPPGRLTNYLGPPAHKFQPTDYGDTYTKLTYLWGNFTKPTPTPVEAEPMPEHLPPGRRDRTSRMSSNHRKQRAETPKGFAKAFYYSNP